VALTHTNDDLHTHTKTLLDMCIKFPKFYSLINDQNRDPYAYEYRGYLTIRVPVFFNTNPLIEYTHNITPTRHNRKRNYKRSGP